MSGPGTVAPLVVAGLLLAGVALSSEPRAPAGGRVSVVRRRRVRRPRDRRGSPAPAPGLAAARSAEQAAALLRAGVVPATAWAVLEEGASASSTAAGREVRVLRAVRHLVVATGAPAADALDACAAGLRADAAAEAAVWTALAGARVSARTVSALPLLGVVLGALLGARPWEVLLTSAPGRTCLVAGVALLVLGHRWSARLVRRAARAGR